MRRLSPRISRSAVLAGLVSALFASTAVPVRPLVVLGQSMAPTLKNGRVYPVDERYYREHPVLRGDVVVFRHNGRRYVKRVMGLGGDAIQLLQSTGDPRFDALTQFSPVKAEDLPGLRRMLNRYPQTRRWMKLVRIEVPRGSCYLIGDNLEASMDSRTFGAVPLSAVLGKVLIDSQTPLRYELARLASAEHGEPRVAPISRF